jgi:type I restriction enzyme S subunit
MYSSCRLDELVAAVDEKSGTLKNAMLPYLGLEHIGQRGGGVIGQADSAASISTNSIFRKRDVLFGKLRPNLRKCALAPFDGYCSTDVLVLRPNDGVDPRFAARVFQTERVGAEAERTAAGTKMPRTSWKELRSLNVFCPDLQSQERIAKVLDTLDTTIRQTEAIIEKLKQLKQGLLHDLLTRGIDANGEMRPPQSQAPHLYKNSPLGWIPREWTASSIDEACSGVVDCPHSTPNFLDDGVLVARTMHIKAGVFLERLASRVSEAEYQERIARIRPEPGDLVLTREAPVGEAFVIPAGMRICLGQRVMLLRLRVEMARGQFVLAQIYSGAVADRIEALTAGTTNPHLNVFEVRQFVLPLPPVQEQELIEQKLGALDQRLAAEGRERDKLLTMKSGLMDDLLTGRVRVDSLIGGADHG